MPLRLLTVVDVLEAAAAAVLHADPELVTTEVGTVVSDDVGVAAVLHHEDLLLDDAKVVALLQLYHLDGRERAGRDAFRLKKHRNMKCHDLFLVHIDILYKVTHLVANLGWVDLDLGSR